MVSRNSEHPTTVNAEVGEGRAYIDHAVSEREKRFRSSVHYLLLEQLPVIHLWLLSLCAPLDVIQWCLT